MSVWDNLNLDRPGPKYLAICEALAEAIEAGTLAPGRRLPSHRMLARRLNVSVGTITRAYDEALERGLITGKVGRGSFVSHHPPMQLTVVRSSRVPPAVLDLWQNLPVAIPDVENAAWAAALNELRRDHDMAAMSRSVWSEVSERSQQAGAAWIRRCGLEGRAKNIIDCPGTMSALNAIFGATTQPGDLVLSASLSHPVIKLIAEQYSLKIHGLPMDDYGIDPDAFESACRQEPPKLLYCTPTIHTPTTKTMPIDRRQAIASIADRYDVLIVEDENAAFLLDEPLVPIAALAPQRCFFIGDVWMALSMGLRTTYVKVPDPLLGAMASAVAATSGVTPPIMAEIAAQWIESDVADRLIDLRRAELKRRNAIARDALDGRALMSDPCGHHLWLELPAPWRSDLFVLRAERLGIAVGGSEWFVVGRETGPAAVRICLGNAPDHDVLRRALEQLSALIDDPRPTGRPSH